MKMRKSLPRSTKPIKRSRIKKKARKPSETLRIYGGKKRIEFVKSLPCAACGVVGYSENAHCAPPSEKGTGYKAGYRFIVPLCGPRQFWDGVDDQIVEHRYFGCHTLYDDFPWIFSAEFPDFDPIAEAAKVEAAWLTRCGGILK